ncbi:MAG: hypothetical protein H6553_02165 [Chitinophagales bacterium]|nr:hypothetical protein [Chitinophagales bacterium]
MNRSFKIFVIVFTIVLTVCLASSCSKDIVVTTTANATEYRDTTINGESAIVIKDLGAGIGSITLTSNRIWVLDGMVYVNSGQALTIQEGTIIKALTGSNSQASALVVAKGAVVIANASAQKPIIFTSIQDDLTMAEVANGDFVGSLTENDNQLWGGLIIMGDAAINTTTSDQLDAITTDARNTFGGTDDNDYSGVLNYVSIRHTGAIDNLAALTLAGVGRNTAIEHIEVIASKYNGIDFIGGNARTKYVLSALANQNSIYCTDGYNGLNQFWMTLSSSQTQQAILVESTTTGVTVTPQTIPVIANATIKGNNTNTIATVQKNGAIKLYNSVVYNFANPIAFEFNESLVNSTYNRYKAGDIIYKDNIFYNIINSTTDTSNFVVTTFISNVTNIDSLNQFKVNLYNDFTTNNNTVEDPLITNEVPQASSPANTAPNLNNISTFFDALITYKGAFKTGENKWTKDWTLASQLGVLPD